MTNKTKFDKFLQKALLIHPNEHLDYSQCVYVNSKTPIAIIDHDLKPDGTEYGLYWQTPENHLRGQGHPLKKGKKIAEKKRANQEEIIKRFKEVHKGENLDYSEVKYVNMHTKVKIISHDLRPDGTEYGEFWQEPVVHLKGCSHPDIGKFKTAQANTKASKYFPILEKSLLCIEDEIYKHLVSIFGKEQVIKNDKTILDGQKIDIFLLEKRIGFDFIDLMWHSEQFKPDHRYQVKKKKLAYEKGISLIPIFEDEFVQKKNIVFDKIDSLLNICKPKYKAYGRKIDVKEITKAQAQEFLDKFHIQGFASATIYLGGFFNGNLIAVMSFIKEKDSFWNLNRYCTDFSYSCPGVAGKMFSSFIKMYQPKEVKSFLDYRWCKNRMENLYTKLGFVEKEILAPDYHYTNGHAQRLHKFGFRKNKLSKKYGLPLSMTETEMTQKLGWTRIWDCGLIKYVWTP